MSSGRVRGRIWTLGFAIDLVRAEKLSEVWV